VKTSNPSRLATPTSVIAACSAALIAKALTRLEQVLNTEIAAEMRSQRQQAEPKPVRAVAT